MEFRLLGASRESGLGRRSEQSEFFLCGDILRARFERFILIIIIMRKFKYKF
jgi:hypothetical protein